MDKIIIHDAWEKLREYTDARIALGRAGSSIPIQRQLEFKLAHAHARDAVYSVMDTESIGAALRRFGLPVLSLYSQAPNRQVYLQRPDLGRLLDANSSQGLTEVCFDNDIALIIADGLSATAINENVLSLLDVLIPAFGSTGLKIAPISLVTQGRVAIGDPIGHGLKSKISLVLIGERPGLSAADSIGAYITYGPKPGLTDESRNCLSNIRPRGLSFEQAARKIIYIINQALDKKLTGTTLKDNTGLVLNDESPTVDDYREMFGGD